MKVKLLSLTFDPFASFAQLSAVVDGDLSLLFPLHGICSSFLLSLFMVQSYLSFSDCPQLAADRPIASKFVLSKAAFEDAKQVSCCTSALPVPSLVARLF